MVLRVAWMTRWSIHVWRRHSSASSSRCGSSVRLFYSMDSPKCRPWLGSSASPPPPAPTDRSPRPSDHCRQPRASRDTLHQIVEPPPDHGVPRRYRKDGPMMTRRRAPGIRAVNRTVVETSGQSRSDVSFPEPRDASETRSRHISTNSDTPTITCRYQLRCLRGLVWELLSPRFSTMKLGPTAPGRSWPRRRRR